MSDTVKPVGYNTPIPAKAMTPDRAERRIGTLEFADGFPTQATADLLFDHLDFLRGVEAFLNGVPAASLEAVRMGMEDVGVTACNQIGILDHLLDAAPLFLTGNTDTVYASGVPDLERDGPTVVEIPPGCAPSWLARSSGAERTPRRTSRTYRTRRLPRGRCVAERSHRRRSPQCRVRTTRERTSEGHSWASKCSVTCNASRTARGQAYRV